MTRDLAAKSVESQFGVQHFGPCASPLTDWNKWGLPVFATAFARGCMAYIRMLDF